MTTDKSDSIERYRANLQGEVDSAQLYKALIYQSKGLDEASAKALAEQLMSNKDTALDTLVREELGIDPQELGGGSCCSGWRPRRSPTGSGALPE